MTMLNVNNSDALLPPATTTTTTTINNSGQQQQQQQPQQYSSTSNTEFKPHELSEAEIKELPDQDKAMLVSMPGEPSCIWNETIGKSGRPYWTAKQEDIIIKAHSILSMLINAQSADFSHIVFGGFAFKYDNGKVIRTTFYKKQPTSGINPTTGKPNYTPKPAPKPRLVAEVFFGNPDQANDHISNHPEMKWETYGEPKVLDDGKVVIGLIRYKAEQ